MMKNVRFWLWMHDMRRDEPIVAKKWILIWNWKVTATWLVFVKFYVLRWSVCVTSDDCFLP